MTREPRNYIEQMAWRIWVESDEDASMYPENEAALWLGYAVLALAKGTATTSEDVHDAWSAWATVQHAGEHRSIVPFKQLSENVQMLDDHYRDAIHRAVRQEF